MNDEFKWIINFINGPEHENIHILTCREYKLQRIISFKKKKKNLWILNTVFDDLLAIHILMTCLPTVGISQKKKKRNPTFFNLNMLYTEVLY